MLAITPYLSISIHAIEVIQGAHKTLVINDRKVDIPSIRIDDSRC